MRQVPLTPQALKDLKDYDDPTQKRVKEALRHLDGKPLKDHLKKEKVWPYRILYRRVGSIWLDVLSIEHRKDVYR